MRQLASFRQSLHLEYRACILSIVQQVAHLTFLSASSCRLQETTRRHGPCDWCLFGLLHPFSLVSHTLSRTLVSHTCLAHPCTQAQRAREGGAWQLADEATSPRCDQFKVMPTVRLSCFGCAPPCAGCVFMGSDPPSLTTPTMSPTMCHAMSLSTPTKSLTMSRTMCHAKSHAMSDGVDKG